MSEAQKAPILGIDLGTTYSLCSVLQNGRPVLLPSALGEVLTPSAVSVDDDGRILVGAAARARAGTHPNVTQLAFKRDMGTDKSYRLGKHTFTPEQLSALILSELKRDAEHALGQAITEAVITVPAYFGEAQRKATRVAGELAGLRVERIINEPTAAAMAYGLHARDRELRAVVLDLGGGTFDVTVLEIIEGVIEVQASAGDARLGGEDFVDLLAQDVARELREKWQLEFSGESVSYARIREASEQAKRTLSTRSEARIVLPGLAASRGLQDVELTLSRERVERLWQPLIERIKQPIARALRDASASPHDFQEVLLVGGATRMPCFVELVARIFGRMPSRHLPPDEAVAMGAAVQAALKEGDKAVEDLIVTDVAPFSLGIASVSKFGQRHVAGIFSPIIDRGTTIPVSRSERFFTIEDNQTKIVVEVYQGEHSLCRDNAKLGAYEIDGLPARPAGEAGIEVRFTYDLNGLLEVDTTIEGTERKKTLTIQQRPGHLSAAQLAQAREVMKRLKFHPRDSLPNRTALARADALYTEQTGEARQLLGSMIAALRAALEAQDAGAINECRERLVALTESIRR